MRIEVFSVVALGLLTAACGSNTTQRAATGGLTGLLAGAFIGGPVGAAVGAGAGAAGGWIMPEGADTLALNAIGKGKQVASAALSGIGLGPTTTPAEGSSRGPSGTPATPPSPQVGSSRTPASAPSPQLVKDAQARLQRDGFYTGHIDGIAGPKTQEAIRIYQRQRGLPQTAQLDQQTLQSLDLLQSGTSTETGGAPSAPIPKPAPRL